MSAALFGKISVLASQALRVAWAEMIFASVVCAVVWLLSRALRRRWPAFQQALWILVLVRLILPPSLVQPFGAGALLGRIGIGYNWDESTESNGWLPLRGTRVVAADAVPSPDADPWAVLVMTAWLLSVGVLLWRDAIGARRYRRILQEAASVSDPAVLETCDRWRRQLGVHRRVLLVTSDAQVAPFVTGFWHPVIFLPAALLTSENRRGLATTLGHELGHVARWDVLWTRVQRIVQRLYFFHPAVWVASRRLRAGREELCDSLVVASGLTGAREYAEGLLDVLELNLRRISAPALTPAKGRIAMRIHKVLSVNRRRRSSSFLVFAATALVGSFLLPLASTSAPAMKSSVTAKRSHIEPAEPDAPESSTLNWAHGLANPLPGGRLRSAFGDWMHPITNRPAFHPGVDISAASGTQVLAPADGRVATVGEKGGYGKFVILDHGAGVVTRFAHLNGYNVHEEQRVQRGDLIAFVGETGRSPAGPHLHYEVWIHGKASDPLH